MDCMNSQTSAYNLWEVLSCTSTLELPKVSLKMWFVVTFEVFLSHLPCACIWMHTLSSDHLNELKLRNYRRAQILVTGKTLKDRLKRSSSHALRTKAYLCFVVCKPWNWSLKQRHPAEALFPFEAGIVTYQGELEQRWFIWLLRLPHVNPGQFHGVTQWNYPVPQNVRLLLLAALGLIIVLYLSGRWRSDVQVLAELLGSRIAVLRFRLWHSSVISDPRGGWQSLGRRMYCW